MSKNKFGNNERNPCEIEAMIVLVGIRGIAIDRDFEEDVKKKGPVNWPFFSTCLQVLALFLDLIQGGVFSW